MRTRTLGGVVFECFQPGTWLSTNRWLCIQETFGFNKWELYRTKFGCGDVPKPPRKHAQLVDVAFAMHDLIETQPRMKDLAREIERAVDWAYNLASGFYDAGSTERFYRRPGCEQHRPTRKKPVALPGNSALWTVNRLPRIKK